MSCGRSATGVKVGERKATGQKKGMESSRRVSLYWAREQRGGTDVEL